MEIGLEKLREFKNEAKRSQGRLRKRKMGQDVGFWRPQNQF